MGLYCSGLPVHPSLGMSTVLPCTRDLSFGELPQHFANPYTELWKCRTQVIHLCLVPSMLVPSLGQGRWCPYYSFIDVLHVWMPS